MHIVVAFLYSLMYFIPIFAAVFLEFLDTVKAVELIPAWLTLV